MKKIGISLIICIILCFPAFAQISFSSASQQMIERAVRDGLVLVRQDYQLEDTLTFTRYSVNNRAEFGSAYSFCVKTKSGYIISLDGLAPWEKDPKYDKYRDSQYRPVLSGTFCKGIKDEEYNEMELAAPLSQYPLPIGGWVMTEDSLFGNQGFAIDTTAGTKDGWLVWLSNSGEDLSAGTLTIATYRYELETNSSISVYEIPAPSLPQYVVGGIYIEPLYQEIGKIDLALVGIVVRDGDGWQLVRCLEAVNEDDSGEDNAEGKSEGNPDLTVLSD